MGSELKAELALDARTILGEGPVCMPDGRVYFIDTDGKRVYSYDSFIAKSTSLALPNMVGCVVPRAKGGLLVALENTIRAIDVDAGEVGPEVAAVPPPVNGPKFRFNDGKCDTEGRFWVGLMNHKEWQDPESTPGKLFVLEPRPGGGGAEAAAHTLTERLPACKLPNGMVWSADQTAFYFVDSFDMKVYCYDFEAASGSISNRRTILEWPESEGQPDGMAVDAGGKLWVALGESGTVRQYDPETRQETTRVRLPVQRPTSCAFGGKDLSELYITTRAEPGDNPSPGAGGLFRSHIPGVKGLAHADTYAG